MRNVVGRFVHLPAQAVCRPQFPPGSSTHLRELFQDFVPACQGRPLCLAERSSIVHGGHALLLMGKQRLYHERLNTSIVQPRRERAPQIMECPGRQAVPGLGELSIQRPLALAPAREARPAPPEYTASPTLMSNRQ